jgi:hypothetical protein
VDIESLLTGQRSEVIDEAFATLERAHEIRYEQSGEEFTRQALSELFDLVVVAVRDRQLGPVSTYCEDVAERRYAAGFALTEVQTAINALEVVMWRRRSLR